MPGERAVSRSRLTPMSLAMFQFELKRRWKILKEEQTAVANACQFFTREKEVWRDQCKNTLMLLYRIERPVGELRILLENPRNLPTFVVQQRHLLLMATQHTDEQNRVLIRHITEFRAQCQSPSKQAAKKRQEIEHELYLFVREYNEMVNSIESLLDQIRFQEKKQMSLEPQRGDLPREMRLYEQQGHVFSEQGIKEKVQEYIEEVLSLVRELKDRELEEQVLDSISAVCNHIRWVEETKELIEEILARIQEILDQLQERRTHYLKSV